VNCCWVVGWLEWFWGSSFFWRAIWLSWERIFNDWNRYYWIRKFRNAKKCRTFYKVLTYIFNELLSKCLTLEGLRLDCEKDEIDYSRFYSLVTEKLLKETGMDNFNYFIASAGMQVQGYRMFVEMEFKRIQPGYDNKLYKHANNSSS